jgi:hypothetical protein
VYVGKCKGRRAVKLFLDATEAMDANGEAEALFFDLTDASMWGNAKEGAL